MEDQLDNFARRHPLLTAAVAALGGVGLLKWYEKHEGKKDEDD